MKNEVQDTNLHPERTFTRSKLLMMAIGTFVGSGLVSLTGPAAAATGYSVWLAYLCAVVVGFLSMLPLVGITSVMNFKGGAYTIATTFLGHQVGGAFVILTILNALIISILGTSFGIYVNSVFPTVDPKVCAVVIVVLFWGIHCLGVNLMASVQKYSSYILLAALAVFCVIAYTNLNPATFDFTGPEFTTNGFTGVFAAMAMLVFSCQSYDNNIVAFGRYTINPRKNMPWGIVATFISLMLIYGFVTVAQVGAVDLAALSGKPLTEISRMILPTWLFIPFIILGPIMCLTTTVNGCFASFTISIAKSSEDGWLPASLSKQGKRGTYWRILTLLAGVCLIPIFMGVSIGVLSSITTLLCCLLQLPLLVSYWKFPDKFAEEFKTNTLNMSAGVFRATVVIAIAARLLLTYCCFRTLTTKVVVGAVIAAACCFIFSIVRYKTAHPRVDDAYFLD